MNPALQVGVSPPNWTLFWQRKSTDGRSISLRARAVRRRRNAAGTGVHGRFAHDDTTELFLSFRFLICVRSLR